MNETASAPALLTDKAGRVMTVTMNRPDAKNSMNPEMLVRMADAWKQADADDEVRVVILTGAAGDFCAGADLDKLVGRLTSGEPPESEWEKRIQADFTIIFDGLLRSYRLQKPLIAAVEGVAIAGGTEILQATDIRVAAESAKFGVSEARWSLFPMGGSTVRLRRQIPYTIAAEILLTGDHYSAAAVKEFGLIGRVVPDGTALQEARSIADTIASNGPLAVQAILRSLRETEGLRETEALDKEFEIGLPVFNSKDAKEGPRAFKEKRTPNFIGE